MAPKMKRRLDGDELIDPRFVKAISHPMRVEIVAASSLAPISEAEFREQSGGKYSKQLVSFHFGVLITLEAIEEVDSRRVRGGLERFYRPTARALFSEGDFARLPPSLRGNLSAGVISSFAQRAEDSLIAGTLDSHPERHLTWTPLQLDMVGFLELVERLDAVFDRLPDMQDEATERLEGSGEDQMHVTIAMFAFESPTPDRNHEIDPESSGPFSKRILD
jgi:hypothetical protein